MHIISVGITCCLISPWFDTLGMHVDIASKIYVSLTYYLFRIYKESPANSTGVLQVILTEKNL